MKKYLLMFVLGLVTVFGISFCVPKTIFASWEDVSGWLSITLISTIMQTSDGSIYIGGRDADDSNNARVWKYSSGVWTNVTGVLSGYEVNSLIEASDGSIYAGGSYYNFGTHTWYTRVWKNTGGNWIDTSLNEASGIVKSLIQVRDGSIYAGGTDGGYGVIWRYHDNSWTGSVEGDLYGINSLIQVADDSIYAGGHCVDGSWLACVFRYFSGSWTDITGSLVGGNISSLFYSSDDSIYAGGYSGNNAKVWQYSVGTWMDLTSANALLGSSVASLVKSLDGSFLYAGGYYEPDEVTSYAKVWKYSTNSWTDVTENLSGDSVSSLIRTTDGSIYAGSVSKVWKYSLEQQEEEQQEEEREQQQQNLELGEKITLESALNGQTITGQSLTINFTKLPTKLTKNSAYWMKWNKLSGYPNKTFLKKWKLKTNLYKYKVKKSSQKYKIKVSFKFTKKQLKKYLKKNKLATKSNLFLKYKKGTGAWQNITTTFTDAKIIKKDKKFIVKYFTKYPVKTQYFAIGVK